MTSTGSSGRRPGHCATRLTPAPAAPALLVNEKGTSKEPLTTGVTPALVSCATIQARALTLPGVPVARPSMPGAVSAWIEASSAVPSGAAIVAGREGVATACADAVETSTTDRAAAHEPRAITRGEDS